MWNEDYYRQIHTVVSYNRKNRWIIPREITCLKWWRHFLSTCYNNCVVRELEFKKKNSDHKPKRAATFKLILDYLLSFPQLQVQAKKNIAIRGFPSNVKSDIYIYFFKLYILSIICTETLSNLHSRSWAKWKITILPEVKLKQLNLHRYFQTRHFTSVKFWKHQKGRWFNNINLWRETLRSKHTNTKKPEACCPNMNYLPLAQVYINNG